MSSYACLPTVHFIHTQDHWEKYSIYTLYKPELLKPVISWLHVLKERQDLKIHNNWIVPSPFTQNQKGLKSLPVLMDNNVLTFFLQQTYCETYTVCSSIYHELWPSLMDALGAKKRRWLHSESARMETVETFWKCIARWEMDEGHKEQYRVRTISRHQSFYKLWKHSIKVKSDMRWRKEWTEEERSRKDRTMRKIGRVKTGSSVTNSWHLNFTIQPQIQFTLIVPACSGHA